MFKVLLGVALFSLAMISFAAPEPAVPSLGEMHEGKVMGVMPEAIMIMDDRDNDMHTFAVTPQTRIVVNGKPAPLDELQMGDRAAVSFRMVNDTATALTINAVRRL